MADSELNASVKRVAAPAADRVVYDADLSSTPLDRVNCGVIFVHASWSVPSVITLRRLADSFVRVDPEGQLSFIVCNFDDVEHLHADLYAGDTTGGCGDVLWISNGVVRARHNASRQCDFDTTTTSLMLEWQTR